MNSTVIIDDIRKRSIRVQRDQYIEQIRREEEIDAMSIPRRFILEAEERARERIQEQGWKKTLFMTLVILVGGFLLVRFLRNTNQPPHPPPKTQLNSRTEIEIRTDDTPPKKTVWFSQTEVDEDVGGGDGGRDKLTRLIEEFPDSWRGFVPNHSPDDLISDLTENPGFDFYDEAGGVAVDFDPEDFFQFPNSITNDEIRFQNMIYDKTVKRTYCEKANIEYYELTL